jgi:hypothetical protein
MKTFTKILIGGYIMLRFFGKKLVVLMVIFSLIILMSGLSFAKDLGVYVKVLETEKDFRATAIKLEEIIKKSDYELIGKWALKVPGKGEDQQRVRNYVINSPEYTDLAAQLAPDYSMQAAILRVSIYEADGKTNINIVNPETLARVFFGEPAEIKDKDQLINKSLSVKNYLINLIKNIDGKIVLKDMEPIRSSGHLDGYNGDGMAKMMVKWRNFSESLHANKEVKVNDNATKVFQQVCNELEDNIRQNKINWKLICKLDIGENARYYGVSKPGVEEEAIEIDSMSREKSEKNKFPGIDHAGSFPIPILVYEEDNRIKVSQFDEMWRMELYFWDAGYGAFTAHMDMPGNIYDDIDKIIHGKN